MLRSLAIIQTQLGVVARLSTWNVIVHLLCSPTKSLLSSPSIIGAIHGIMVGLTLSSKSSSCPKKYVHGSSFSDWFIYRLVTLLGTILPKPCGKMTCFCRTMQLVESESWAASDQHTHCVYLKPNDIGQ